MRSNPLLSFGLIALAAVGCGQGGGDATVEGKVTIDGFPLESGSVVFISAGSKKMSAASGAIDELGNYKLVIGRGSELDSGEYLAQVKAVGPSTEREGGGPPLPGPLLTPAKYAKAETSGLRYRLRPGKNVIDIALTSDAEPEADAAEESGEEPSGESAEEEAATEESGAEESEAEGSEEAAEPSAEQPVEEAAAEAAETAEVTAEAAKAVAE